MTEGLTGVGAELARAREAQGLTLVDVAQQLKLAPRQIESLEQERYEALPGPTIARGMLRNYARLLGLDDDVLLERLGARLDAPDADRLAARFREAVPFSDTARRSTLTYVGLSVVVLAVVGAMGYQWREERTAARALAFVPAAKVPLEPPLRALPDPAPMPPSKLAVRESAPAPAASEPELEAKATPEPAAKGTPEPADERVAEEAKSPPEPTVVAAKPAATGPAHRLVLRCDEESWVEITDGLDRVLVWSLLPSGTQRVVEGQPPFRVVIGNAQYVEVTYDGRPVDLRPRTRGDVARLTVE